MSVLALGIGALAGVAAASPPDGGAGGSQAGSHQSSGTAGTSGDTASPQPTSNADSNDGGANGQCPGGTYCSTRHGAASDNGNGGGNATGKPCAGCVGKADNKNPPGQEKSSPRAVFPNNGYECDNNSGIGRTNPAHTGCATASYSGGGDCATNPTAAGCSSGSECTSDCTSGSGCTSDCTSGSGCTSDCTSGSGCTSDCSQSGGATVLGETVTNVPATKAPTTAVLGERITKAPPAAVAGRRVTQTPSALPFTGLPVGMLLGLGAGAALAGSVLLGVGLYRRRSLAH